MNNLTGAVVVVALVAGACKQSAAPPSPPTVSITSPADGATVSGTVSVTAAVSGDGAVTHVDFYVDGALVGSDGSPPYSFTWGSASYPNGAHDLQAKAYDAAGDVGSSGVVAVTVSNGSADITPPSAPTGLTATARSSSEIDLAWIASTDNVGVTGYTILRGTTSGGPYAQVGTSVGTSFQDVSGLSANTTYYVVVQAVDAAGNVSANSTQASATTTASASGTTYYVATTGSDANPGTATAPFRTIQMAGNVVNPGDVVIVRDGVYSEEIALGRGGTASAWVTFRAEHRWGAKLDGRNNTLREAWNFDAGANYIHVEGFELYGYHNEGFTNWGGGEHLEIVGNHIHNIGNLCSDESVGLEGMAFFHPNVTIEGNLLHDIGRYAAGENGCNPSSTAYQDHDHPISLEESAGNITIKNNILYNMKRGYGIQLYGGTFSNIYIWNNTFAFANPYTDGHIIVAASLADSHIDNNVFYDPRNVALVFSVSGHSNLTVRNNTVYLATTYGGAPSGVSFSGNQDDTDPRLVNPAGFDFHLQSGSPAIDSGLRIPEVTRDFDGNTRPQGAGYDRGAYERP